MNLVVEKEEMSVQEYKKEMVRILKYIDEICEKNNIKYSIIAGSLIGCIRHKGFIPWDDDIDIGLLYDDYIKLMDLLKQPNEEFQLISYETNKNYNNPHVKLVSKKTFLIEKDFEAIEEMGVFIDIFAYMYMPDDEKERHKFYKKLCLINKFIMGLRKPSKSEDKYILRYIRYIVSKYFITRKRLFRKLNNLYEKYESGKYIIDNYPIYGEDKDIKEAKIFSKIIKKEFENIEVNCFEDYDKYLTATYGNYMELPPENKRVNHKLKVYYRN